MYNKLHLQLVHTMTVTDCFSLQKYVQLKWIIWTIDNSISETRNLLPKECLFKDRLLFKSTM